MKILERNLKRGVVKVLPERIDDLWHLYNIIYKNDEVYAYTTREIKVQEDYARPKEGRRVSVFLGVKVEKVSWDRHLNRLRVQGIVCKAPEKVSIKGLHHTINVTSDKPITIIKSEWLKHHLDRLNRAGRVKAIPISIMSIDDEEYCVAVLRQYGVEIKIEEKVRIPGKMEEVKRAEAKQELFKKALKALENVRANIQGPIVIIGLGFIKNEFVKYIKNNASDVASDIIDVKSVNSGGSAGINEALRSGVLTRALRHTEIVEETKMMEEVLTRLGKGRSDVTYGFVNVEKASMYGAVEKLLLADINLRGATDVERLALEGIMRDVENKGGWIMVLSTEHEAGKKLVSMGGIAALLRFSLNTS